MENNVFDAFLDEIRNPEQEPKTIQELAKQRGIIGDFAVQQCEQLRKDASKPTAADPLDVEQSIMQERIRKAISEPTQAGQGFTAGSGRPLSKSAEPERDELMYLLGAEIGDAPLPRFESVRDLGREPLPPGPGLRLTPGTTLPDVLDLVARRAPTPAGREFAKSLSVKARELEVL